MKFIELESERLIYRKFMQEDFPVVFDWLSNAENMKYRMEEPRNKAEVQDYLNWAISNADARKISNYEYAVVIKESNMLIGSATLMDVPKHPEVGWMVHRNYWKQGYGTEIGKTLLTFGFETLNIRRIIAGCNARNHGSYKIMERIGMRREAHNIKAQLGNSTLNHEWCDRFWYAMLREEWKEQSGSAALGAVSKANASRAFVFRSS